MIGRLYKALYVLKYFIEAPCRAVYRHFGGQGLKQKKGTHSTDMRYSHPDVAT